jgi:thiol-disulfide isomerase/thioredoxin
MAEPEFYSGKVLYPAIAVLVALSALFGLAILPRFSTGASYVGKAAPDVTLPVAANGDEGARMRLSDLKGRAVVLDFWASWCGPCKLQAPILDRVARRYEPRGLVVLGINVDDTPELARSFATRKGLSYPILVDEGKAASAAYDVDKLPSLVVIDKEGRVVSYTTGLVDEGALDEIVATSL